MFGNRTPEAGMAIVDSTASDGATEDGRPPEFVRSLDRGLAVIRAFSAEAPSLTLSDVARATGLTRAAARRFLLTLEALGYVGSDDRRFHLRPKVLELGYAYLASLTFEEVALEHMRELVEEVHESSSASVLDGTEIVYVARVPAKRIMSIGLNVGTRLPAFCTSMGRVLLAAQPEAALDDYFRKAELEARTSRTVTDVARLRRILADVRAQGWAMVDQELEDGVRSVAVPIRGPGRTVLAAMNISAHAARVRLDVLRKRYLPLLQTAACRIEADLSGRR
jgi:IclR family pca regulon transcriptional regulator